MPPKKEEAAVAEETPVVEEAPAVVEDVPADPYAGMKSVHINSYGIDTIGKKIGNETVRFYRVEIDGKFTDVECDRQVHVPPEVYEVIMPMIDRRRKGY